MNELIIEQEKHDMRVLDFYKTQVKYNTLVIDQSDIVQNIQFIDQLPINILKIFICNDIRFDRVPTKLTNIQLTSCPKTNFTGFEQMKQLTVLTLNYNQLSHINFLGVLVNLTYLNICSNEIQNISPIKNLIQLKQIKMEFNQIQDISPLRKLIKLEIINLNSNQVIDVNPLKYLKQLRQLYVQQNLILNIKPIQRLRKLVVCNVNYNFIEDLSDMPQIPWSEDENVEEQIGFELFDKEKDIQFIPTKQQQHFSNKIIVIYEYQDKLKQQCEITKTTTFNLKQQKNRAQQLLIQQIDSHFYWSRCVTALFQANNSVNSQ
ncbi:leucine-rich_repeat domain-containing protein [Hexamita inflata]|uniref:Leucine-rich_repeat domain-containing protein n=1 Tax=Hexamita inflata TaxID=28002 RepID=A0ABP1HH14_9EUKA